MKEKTLGRELVEAVREALASKEKGKTVRPKIDIAAIRKKLGMTQAQFSKEYHIKLETLRNWEQEKRFPDTTVLAYLTCIAKRPRLIREMLNSDVK
jgi:putative transcriptional regulator